MNTIASKGIQEYGQGSHKGFTFTGSHLGNLSLMQNNTTKQLYVVVYHFPFQVVTSGCPVIVIDSLVAINSDEVFLWIAGQLTVEVGSCHYGLLVLGKASCSLLYNGEYLRHYHVEGLFVDFQYFFFNFIDLCKNISTLIDRGILDGSLQLFYTSFLHFGRVLYLLLQYFSTLTQCVVIQLLNFWIYSLYLLYKRLYKFHVA